MLPQGLLDLKIGAAKGVDEHSVPAKLARGLDIRRRVIEEEDLRGLALHESLELAEDGWIRLVQSEFV